ncbi:MAG: hypothetical protein DSY47_08325 [Hydrogenothermus sp.]|nr:MAG: hypothetical protein DSY47_08325 [Hydrogenothermus sp.]
MIVDINKNDFMFFFILKLKSLFSSNTNIISPILIYTFLHYINKDLDFYLPLFILSSIGLISGYIYYQKTKNYIKTLIIFFISISISTYSVFLMGGIGNVGFIWSILLIGIVYFLLPIKYANRFVLFYTTLIVFSILLYLKGIINLPYEKSSLITIVISIVITAYVANTIIQETLENLQKLAKLANFDTLTMVYNRRKILQILNDELDRAKRYKRPLSILMIDVDNFKKLNDNFGHQFGDKVLQDFAILLKNIVRKTDVIGRTGGEEFLVILPETDLEGAKYVAEKIRKAVEDYFKGHCTIDITVSIGVAQVREPICSIDSILHEADIAMYKAKGAGKNRVEIYKYENTGQSPNLKFG